MRKRGPMSQECKDKIAARARERWSTKSKECREAAALRMIRDKPGVLTEEHKAKVSASLRKRWSEATPEERAAHGDKLRGVHLSEQHRKAIGDAQRGRIASSAAVEMNRASHVGITQSEEAREKKRVAANAFYAKLTPEERRSMFGRDLPQRRAAAARALTSKPSALHLKVKAGMDLLGIATTTHVPVGWYILDEGCRDLKFAVEINGCYWHFCPVCNKNPGKQSGSDNAKRAYLKKHGWTLLEVWEHEWVADPLECLTRIKDAWLAAGGTCRPSTCSS